MAKGRWRERRGFTRWRVRHAKVLYQQGAEEQSSGLCDWRPEDERRVMCDEAGDISRRVNV